MPNPSHEQVQRRDTLRSLLQRHPAHTQQSLVDALGARGFAATQSSVSRDLRELGAVKTRRGYELPGEHAVDRETQQAIAEFVRSVTPAGPNLTVVKTAIGAAQRVALALDRADWPEMIGNIGGDDTVFVASNSAAAQKVLVARIERART